MGKKRGVLRFSKPTPCYNIHMQGSKTSSPLVSIIVPIYNAEKYLTECLESATKQSYQNIEIICINDGSTDGSAKILKKFADKKSNITVITQKNAGIISARNNAISKAKGHFILPLDSDDRISNNLVEKLVQAMQEYQSGVACTAIEFFGKIKGSYNLPEPTAQNMAIQNCLVNCAMFTKESWKKYGGYDKRFVNGIEDYDFWWNFVQDNKQIIRIHDAVFYYRIKNADESRNLQTIHLHKNLEKLMLKKYPLMRKLRLQHNLKRRVKTYAIHKPKEAIKMGLRSTNIVKWRSYKNYVLNQQLDKSDFVPITKTPYAGGQSKKLIAFYLPQYYQIPQNDEWFGRGFTEWTNAAKAVPQFTGHWQPHLPIDVGFYNLETTKVMHRQVELAKMYGIHGFCFYYYWFSGGHRIMEKPLDNWLADKSIDFPFMFFWANEDWTNTWGEAADAGTKVFSAKMKPSDVKKFADDLMPFLQDKRYITIEGRPHIIIYQAKKDPYLKEFISKLGNYLEKSGIKKPYISLVFPDDSPDTFNPLDYGADAAVEFGVHMKVRPDYTQKPKTNNNVVNPGAKLQIFDMEKFIDDKNFLYNTDFPVHRGAMTTYDNTARKIYTNAYLFALSPHLYKRWLSELLRASRTDYVFISAWNEWAEGMHLEPDQRHGYAYLQATKDALEESSDS